MGVGMLWSRAPAEPEPFVVVDPPGDQRVRGLRFYAQVCDVVQGRQLLQTRLPLVSLTLAR
jgi:hypothetical protein